jgi:hypothetical protein
MVTRDHLFPLGPLKPSRNQGPPLPLDRQIGVKIAERAPALSGDDVQLEYYEDGYPKLPACLDRRQKPEPLAEAA